MKRKLFFFTVVAALFGIIIFLIMTLKIQRDNLYSKSLKQEDLVFFDLNGHSIYPLQGDEATVLINFNSGCEHCINEIAELNKNSSLFKNNTIFFVSDEPAGVLKKMDSIYGISVKGVFKILCDSMKSFEKNFGNKITPAILLFDKKGILINEYSGEVSASVLSKHLSR